MHQERPTTLGEAVVSRIRRPIQRQTREEFWALRDVSFDVARGEVVGVIGRNGAGKSTLLKILSRIATPTDGQIELHGRVGSLLEVGTGFHPELTGRENIFLNGAILGMRHREIERHFDEIVDFAGVEQFLDTPVKRYSSGMYVRLAFAVAAHLSSDILIIDEVLAVGDAEFQKKCLNKMQDIANDEGRTILFVSHSMASIQSLCPRCVLLHKGSVAFDGPSKEGSERYLKLLQEQAQIAGGALELQEEGQFDLRFHENPYLDKQYLQKVTLLDNEGNPSSHIGMGETLTVMVDVDDIANEDNIEVVAFIRTQEGLLMCSHPSPPTLTPTRSSSERFVLQIPSLPFTPGTYGIDIMLRSSQHAKYVKLDRANNLIQFTIHPRDVLINGYEFSQKDGLVYLQSTWDRVPLTTGVMVPNGKTTL